MTNLQAQTLINGFNHINTNQPVKMADMNDVLSPFEGNINTGDITVIKLYLQSTKEIDKETDKIDIPVLNSKDIVDQFFS